jgi:hypothetical protein
MLCIAVLVGLVMFSVIKWGVMEKKHNRKHTAFYNAKKSTNMRLTRDML